MNARSPSRSGRSERPASKSETRKPTESVWVASRKRTSVPASAASPSTPPPSASSVLRLSPGPSSKNPGRPTAPSIPMCVVATGTNSTSPSRRSGFRRVSPVSQIRWTSTGIRTSPCGVRRRISTLRVEASRSKSVSTSTSVARLVAPTSSAPVLRPWAPRGGGAVVGVAGGGEPVEERVHEPLGRPARRHHLERAGPARLAREVHEHDARAREAEVDRHALVVRTDALDDELPRLEQRAAGDRDGADAGHEQRSLRRDDEVPVARHAAAQADLQYVPRAHDVLGRVDRARHGNACGRDRAGRGAAGVGGAEQVEQIALGVRGPREEQERRDEPAEAPAGAHALTSPSTFRCPYMRS